MVAVELVFGADFELQNQDAEVLIRLRDGAVLWQKERLLNLALQAVPAECRKIAWLDCDILFGAPDWAKRIDSTLNNVPIVQLFKKVHYLRSGWSPGKELAPAVEFTRPSAAFAISSGIPAATCLGHSLDHREGTAAPGFAWGVRREVLERHGFFDACILGGGDRAMACAGTHSFDELMDRHYMNAKQREHYMGWARPFYETVRGEIGYFDQDIFHLWHGDVADRRTRSRHAGLQTFNFDPFSDIQLNSSGSWCWSSDKHELHEYVRGYFTARREDG